MPDAPPRAHQSCINAACGRRYPVSQTLIECPACHSLLDIDYDWADVRERIPGLWWFNGRSSTTGPRHPAGSIDATPSALDFSGVWRFRDLLRFYSDESEIVTLGEGRTNLQRADLLARELGVNTAKGGRLYLQYEGFNPSGSFKDNGMTAAFTHARMVGARRVACASTGNTSASLAVYASLTQIPATVFIGDGKIAYGKLAQALDYGAQTLQIAGDFDACLARLFEIVIQRPELGVYLMNSVNPFRLEGQKTIMYRVLEGLDWRVPDWIVVPGGNLGNSSAFGKAFIELKALGLIDRIPRLAVIQAQGACTLDRLYNKLAMRWTPESNVTASRSSTGSPSLRGSWDHPALAREYTRMTDANERASTIASAIEINRPVNLPKCLRALHAMDGVVRSIDDGTIIEHKSLVGRYGFGCEPASGASVAGARRLIEEGVISPDQTVVCILTGHALKDPDVTVAYHTGIDTKKAGALMSELGLSAKPAGRWSNAPIKVKDDLESIITAMGV
jgi:threonine synthase